MNTLFISSQNCIRCYFDSYNRISPINDIAGVDIYFAVTRDLFSSYPSLLKKISEEEIRRAERFHVDEDRNTYITTHALLRSLLSKDLKIKPPDIKFNTGINNKPELKGHTVSFNISHTRDAFAIAISKCSYVGVDLEKASRDLSFNSILKSYFSQGEKEFILDSGENAKNSFLLLWTRKEALLKALGTGIINELPKLEVFQPENCIKEINSCNSGISSLNYENFIYSTQISDCFLSVAVPQRADIIVNQINEANLSSFISL